MSRRVYEMSWQEVAMENTELSLSWRSVSAIFGVQPV